jgi:hypothetical protein
MHNSSHAPYVCDPNIPQQNNSKHTNTRSSPKFTRVNFIVTRSVTFLFQRTRMRHTTLMRRQVHTRELHCHRVTSQPSVCQTHTQYKNSHTNRDSRTLVCVWVPDICEMTATYFQWGWDDHNAVQQHSVENMLSGDGVSTAMC